MTTYGERSDRLYQHGQPLPRVRRPAGETDPVRIAACRRLDGLLQSSIPAHKLLARRVLQLCKTMPIPAALAQAEREAAEPPSPEPPEAA